MGCETLNEGRKRNKSNSNHFIKYQKVVVEVNNYISPSETALDKKKKE